MTAPSFTPHLVDAGKRARAAKCELSGYDIGKVDAIARRCPDAIETLDDVGSGVDATFADVEV